MNHLDLFSGIGGFALAASWVWGEEHNITSFVEIDPFCQKVLKKHWPDVPIISDIKDVNYERILADTRTNVQGSGCGEVKEKDGEIQKRREKNRRSDEFGLSGQGVSYTNDPTQTTTNPTIDLLTGGFPCQPFSCAGKRGGKNDDRYLWPEMLRVIREIQPTWIIGENVAGIINLELDTVLSDLEASEYSCQAFVIPAAGVDAPHRRDRVWIVANSLSNSEGRTHRGASRECGQDRKESSKCERNEMGCDTTNICQDVADSKCVDGVYVPGLEKQPTKHPKFSNSSRGNKTIWCPESRLGDMVDGVSRWLAEPDIPRVATGIKDRTQKLKGLGNAIVPQCVVPIMQAIKEINDTHNAI